MVYSITSQIYLYDTALPLPGLQEPSSPRYLCSIGNPPGTFALNVYHEYRPPSLPAPPRPPLSWRWQQLGDSNRTHHRLLRRRRPAYPAFELPPPLTGPKPPVALQPSSTALPQKTFPIPVHRYPGAQPSADTAHLLPTVVRHHSLPSSRVLFFVFVFLFPPGDTLIFRRPNVPSSMDTKRVPLRFPTPFPAL